MQKNAVRNAKEYNAKYMFSCDNTRMLKTFVKGRMSFTIRCFQKKSIAVSRNVIIIHENPQRVV